MGNKEAVIELVNRLPENVSLREIAQEIEFVAAIQEGLDQGQGISLEDVEKMIDLWTTK